MSRTITCALTVLLVLVSSASSSRATAGNVYYVAPFGNDAVSCTSAQNIATPKRTIQNSLMNCRLGPGDKLYIRAGTYVEFVHDRLWSYGATGNPASIEGYPGDARPVIRPIPATPNGVNDSNVMVIFGAQMGNRTARHLILKGFELDASDMGPNHGNSCLLLDAPNVTVDDVIFRNCSRDGISMFSANLVVKNSQILACGRNQPPEAGDNTKGVAAYIAPDGDPANPAVIGGNNIFEYNLVDGCRAAGPIINYDKSDNNIIRFNIIRNLGASSPYPTARTLSGQFGMCHGIGGTQFGANNGPRFNKIYNNLCYNVTGSGGDHIGVGVILWGGRDNEIYNNTWYNMDRAIQVTCGSNNMSYQVKNNIWSNFVDQSNWPAVQSACNGVLTGTISNNLLNPPDLTTFVDATNGDLNLKAGSSAMRLGAGATIPP